MTLEQVAQRFQLGRLVSDPVRVPGGLSNELWRLVTADGVFAVKRMVLNADQPEFVDNVEAAFGVERRAWAAGVAMPQPVAVPGTGRALAQEQGSLFRVHGWVDGLPGEGSAAAAAGLLASIHAVGNPRWGPALDTAWEAARWGAQVAELAQRVRSGPDRSLIVDSHRDLDRKNTVLDADGVLMAVDWDAAGPVSAVHEAAGLALDCSEDDPAAFADAIRDYGRRSGVTVPAQPWIFAGWVIAQGGWLDYQATHQGGSPAGQAQVAATLTRLRTVAARLDALLAAMSSTADANRSGARDLG